MNKILTLAVLTAAALAAGCADTPTTASADEQVSSREYPTGSSIPRKRTSTDAQASQEALDRARSQVPATPNPGIPGSRPGG
jgi:hypothetical protein